MIRGAFGVVVSSVFGILTFILSFVGAIVILTRRRSGSAAVSLQGKRTVKQCLHGSFGRGCAHHRRSAPLSQPR